MVVLHASSKQLSDHIGKGDCAGERTLSRFQDDLCIHIHFCPVRAFKNRDNYFEPL
jgi:hypothetical protein